MIRDFNKLLSTFASGDHEALLEQVAKRKNSADKAIIPTPSQAAVQDIGEVVASVADQSGEQAGKSAKVFGQPPQPTLGGAAMKAPEPYGVAQTEAGVDQPTDYVAETAGWGSPPKPVLSPLEQTRAAMREASVVHPSSRLQDIPFGVLQGLNNVLNGSNSPIKSWGELGRDKRVARLMPQLAMLEQEEKQNQAAAQNQSEIQYRQAQAKKAAADAQKQLADIESQKQKDALAGKKWEQFETDGKWYKKNADGSIEPLIINGQQATKLVNVPVSGKLADGTPIYQTGAQAKTAEVTALNNDANREQRTREINAQKTFEAQKETANNLLQYQGRVAAALQSAITADTTLANNTVVQGINKEVQAKNDELQNLIAEPPSEDEKVQANRVERINKLSDSIQSLSSKAQDEIGKSEQGRAKAQQFKSTIGTPPAKITYTPIEAVKTSGKIAPSSQVDAFAQSKGWTRAQAEKYLKSNGYTIQ